MSAENSFAPRESRNNVPFSQLIKSEVTGGMKKKKKWAAECSDFTQFSVNKAEMIVFP